MGSREAVIVDDVVAWDRIVISIFLSAAVKRVIFRVHEECPVWFLRLLFERFPLFPAIFFHWVFETYGAKASSAYIKIGLIKILSS